jgi:hypothetical protein
LWCCVIKLNANMLSAAKVSDIKLSIGILCVIMLSVNVLYVIWLIVVQCHQAECHQIVTKLSFAILNAVYLVLSSCVLLCLLSSSCMSFC